MTDRQYLIWDNIERGAFHRPNMTGYTCDINEAGRFPAEQARRVVANAGISQDGTPDTIMMLEPTGRIVLPPSNADLAQLRATVRRYAKAGAAAIFAVNRVRSVVDQLANDLATIHVEQLRQALDGPAPAEPNAAPSAPGDPVHAAAESAMAAVVARLQPHATEPHGDLAINPKRAGLMAVDAAAPILLAAGRAQAERQLQEGDLAPWIARAAAYPGCIAGRRRGPSWGEGEEGYAEEQETVSAWVQRAVRMILDRNGQPRCERCCEVIRVDDGYDPPLPGIGLWEHEGVCPPRVAPDGCDECLVDPGERHRFPECPGNQRAIERELTHGA